MQKVNANKRCWRALPPTPASSSPVSLVFGYVKIFASTTAFNLRQWPHSAKQGNPNTKMYSYSYNMKENG